MALVLVAFAVGLLILLRLSEPRRLGPAGAIDVSGLTLPEFKVDGWLNVTESLTADDLSGQIVLIDCWATWCGPCVVELPELIEFHERYADRGVTVVGLTDEPGGPQSAVAEFVGRRDGMDWPIAYGADRPMLELGVEYLPTYYLFDRKGRAVAAANRVAHVEEELVRLLAREKSAP